jgi:hypothetical protein
MAYLKRNWKWLVLLYAIGFMAWALPRLSSSWQLKHRQAELLTAISERDVRTYMALVSANYRDDWEFRATEIHRAMGDVAAQFLVLEIRSEDETWAQTDQIATYRARLKLDGRAVTPLGGMMLGESQRLTTPFEFEWEKESWLPWSWRVRAIRNESLDVPEGYEPGDYSGIR